MKLPKNLSEFATLLFMGMAFLHCAGLRIHAAPPASVTKVSVNEGAAQRSTVTSVALEFSADVAAYLRKEHLYLRNLTTGQIIDPAVFDLRYDVAARHATWSFPSLTAASLAEGNYLAVLKADAVVPPLANRSDTSPGLGVADTAFTFFRRFGDSDGDRDVDFLDTARFRRTWNKSIAAAEYAREFDSNIDGVVNNVDLALYRNNYFTFFPDVAAIHAALLNDTGVSSSDGITLDPTVSGVVFRPNPGTVFRSSLKLAASPGAAALVDTTADLAPDGTFVFPHARLAQIQGSPLNPGAYTLHFETVEAGAVTSLLDLPFTLSGIPCELSQEAGWTVSVSQPSGKIPNAVPGSAVFANCEALLTEGDSFSVAIERNFAIPQGAGLLVISYETPTFDTSATGLMRDAFEAAIVDAAGRPLTFTIQGSAGVAPASSSAPAILPASPDAFFNHSDGKTPFAAPGSGAVLSTSSPQISTIYCDVRQLVAGSNAHLILRLVNNDRDKASRVRITDVAFQPFNSGINLAGSPLTALSLLVGSGTSGGVSPNPNTNGSGSPTFGNSGSTGPKIVFGTTSSIGGGGPSPTLITDPNDPRTWQGATVGTFAQLYYGSNTLANRQRVIDNRLLDAGLFNLTNTFPATLVTTPWATGGGGGFLGRSLDLTGTGGYDYSDAGVSLFACANGIDNLWFQSSGTIGETVFDLGVPSLKAAVFNSIDHGPLPLEAIESTAYLSNDRVNWTQAVVQRVWLEGWQPILGIQWDGFAFAVGTADNTPFRYVSIIHGGPGGLQSDGDDEINGILGLDADFNPTIQVAPPTVAIVTPADNSRQTAPRMALLTGYAIADTPLISPGTLATNRIVLVTVNGRPVDTLDSAGNFFGTIEIRPGANTFTVVATDAYSLSTTNAVTVYGDTGATNTTTLGVVSGGIIGEYGRTTFHERTRTLYADLAVRNAGNYPIRTPLYVGIANISDPSVRLLGTDGISADGIPYYDYSLAVPSGTLNPQQTTLSRSIAFYNPSHVQFRYDLVVLGQLNQAPYFTTTPTLEASPAHAYSYPAKATDPDGDTLTYSLAQSPSGLTISASTGLVSWTPTAAQLGTHDIRIRADDGKGGIAEQHYLISVISVPANRPPYFISVPVSLARPFSYSYDADALDPDSDLLTYSLLTTPAGMTINSATGAVSWAPNAGQIGTHSVSIKADDGRGGTATQSYQICVLPAEGNRAPVFVTSPSTTVIADQVIQGTQNDLLFTVPGIPGQPVNATFRWTIRGAAYNNEFGIYRTDFDGRAGNLLPGDAGYSRPALSTTNSRVIFASGQGAGATKQVTLNGGEIYGFYIIQNNTTDNFRASNPDNLINGFPLAFFSFQQANPDGQFDHLRTILDQGVTTFYWEDLTYGGDQSFTDVVFTIDLALLPGGRKVYTYQATAIDADGDVLNYQLAQGPTNATINAQTGLVSWLADIGQYDFRIQVSDGRGGVEEQAFTVNVVTPGTSAIQGGVLEDSSNAVGRVVFLDLNNNGKRDPSESSATTDNNGSYSFTNLPAGSYTIRVEPQPGWLIVAPATGFLQVSLTAGQNVTGFNFDLHRPANPTNSNPAFTSIAPARATTNGIYLYFATATDPDADSLTFDLVTQPAGMFVDAGSGVLAWRPILGQIGVYDVILRVQDGLGGIALQSFQIAVAAQNIAPVITSLPPGPAVAQLPYRYGIRAQDADGQPLTFSLAAGAPVGVSLDPQFTTANSAVLQWTPALAQLGGNAIEIIVRDPAGGEARQAFILEVVASSANKAPVFVSTARTKIRVDLPYSYLAEATDADGDPLSFQLVSGPVGMTLANTAPPTFNARILRWTPTAAQFGNNAVVLRVSDGRGGLVDQSFTVQVGSSLDNHPPEIVSTPPLHATSGQLYEYNLKATDSDGDDVTWRLVSGPVGTSLDVVTGALRWNPTLAQLGANSITVEAKDTSAAATTQTWTIDVGCLNRPPAITSAPPIQAQSGEPYLYAPRASDPDGDRLSWSLTANPTGMTIDAATGLIRWTPTAAQVGAAVVTLRVSDGKGGTETQTFTLNTGNARSNRAPVITSTPLRGVAPTRLYSYAVTATDSDGDSLTLSLLAAPAGATLSTTASLAGRVEGLVSWTPTAAQSGPQEFIVSARDPSGASASQRFFVTVRTNAPPVISSSPMLSAVPAVTYRYDVQASDPNGDLLSYNLTQAPAGMNIDSFGRIVWTPTIAQIGAQNVALTVSDGAGGTANQSYTVTVGADTELPTVDLQVGYNLQDQGGNLYIEKGTQAVLTVAATDNVGVTARELRLDGVPIALNADGSGVANFPTAGFVQAVATARDAAGNTAQVTKSIPVVDQNAANTITVVISSPANSADVTQPVNVVGTITSQQAQLTRYQVEIAELTSGTGSVNLGVDDPALSFQTIANVTLPRGTTSVNNAILARFDPTLLQNGGYLIRVSAFDTNGKGRQDGVLVNVTGNLKLGQFRLEFTDLSIPLAGIPIRINRIYDSRDAKRKGDFGYGWTLGLQNARILEVGKIPFAGLSGVGFTFTNKTRVYLTAPDGRRLGFSFSPVVEQNTFFGTFYRPAFVADPGIYDKLEPIPNSGGYQLRSDGGFVAGFGLVGYDPSGYRLTTKDNLVYEYDEDFGLKKVTDLNGNVVNFSANGITSSTGVSIPFTRDAQGRITKITDPDGNNILYSYNASGDLQTVTDRAVQATQFHYLATPAHYLNEIVDPLGRMAVRTEYDAAGRVTAVIDALGNRQEQGFVPEQLTGTRTDGRGNVTNLTFNARGNILTETKPESGVTRYEYNDPANPDKETAKIDPLGNRTEFTWDARGNKLTEKDALGTLTEFGYNALNKVTSLKRKNAQGTLLTSESAEYDAKGNLTKLINPAGDDREFIYDAQGRLIVSFDFNGNPTQYDHLNGCACGSPSKITYADGTTKLFEYNAFGQVTKVTDETGAITRTAFDAVGRKTSETDHDGNVTRFEYDANNNQTKRTDRLGHVTKSIFDDKNQLSKEIKILTNDGDDTNDVILNYEYDRDGHLTALIDPVGNRTQLDFDGDGRLMKRTDAAGVASFVHYDLAGNTSDVIDRNGRKRSFLYDARNQPTKERWHDAGGNIIRTIDIAYDALGRRTSIADPDSALAYEFDAASRVAQVSNAGTPNLPLVVLNYGYDKDGHTKSVTDNAGVSVQTTFDVRGQSDHFIWSGGGISPASVNLDRNGRGQVTAINRHSNATLSSLVSRTTYDQIAPQGWVKQIQHRQANGQLYNAGTNFTYGYDAEGEVVSQSSQGNSTGYDYDPTGQLLAATHSDPAYPDETYAYDKAGNRTSSYLSNSYTTGAANRLLSDGKFSYGYDAEGNVITKTEIATGKVTQFAYDHRGRLTSIIDRASVGGTITSQQSFIYDAADRRIAINANGSITNIVYHGENAWGDYTSAGSVRVRYLFADRIDGNIAKWTSAVGTEWYLIDKTNSVGGVTAQNGVLSGVFVYDSFGSTLPIGAPSVMDRYGFSGREIISPSTYFARSRLYDSRVGRFLEEDRVGFGGGDSNLFRYVYNDPLRYVDPYGEGAFADYAIKIAVFAGRTLTKSGPVGTASRAIAAYLVDAGCGVAKDLAGIKGDNIPPVLQAAVATLTDIGVDSKIVKQLVRGPGKRGVLKLSIVTSINLVICVRDIAVELD